MLPFLEIEIGIVNSEKQEKTAIARIQPQEIEYYYPGFYTGTIVVMKSGQSYLAMMNVTQFDNALGEYDKFIKSKAGKFGNLSITPKKVMHAAN